MDKNNEKAAAPGDVERLPLRDMAIVLVTVVAGVLANVGVVRALDAALDALHR